MKYIASLVMLVATVPLGAQAPGPVVGAGYRVPAPLDVAPGQVITLFVRRDAADSYLPLTATASPLPYTLNDYRVNLVQSDWPDAIRVPLQAVYPVENCVGGTPLVCAPLAALTVQIPWELVPNFGRRPQTFATLTVMHGTAAAEPVPLTPRTDRIHVLTTCDSTLPPGQGDFPYEPGPCRSIVTHLDGSLIGADSPAAPGETVVALVFGLGRTEDGISTGEVAVSPKPVTGITLGFQFGADLEAARPLTTLEPTGVELSRDRVGLYRVTFVVPALPDDTPSCTATAITSNVTVTILGTASLDGAGLCVEP